MNNDEDCINQAQSACEALADCFAYWHANHGGPEIDLLHGLASRIASRFETLTGAPAGSLSNPRPLDGTPKQ